MNFESNESFEKQLSRVLAMIIMFEKKIERLRKKLAGNEEFHTRLVFHKIDMRKRGQIRPQDLAQVLPEHNRTANANQLHQFCRKHTVSGAITYDEILRLMAPKTDQTLCQRLMVRTAKRGATLPNYLWKSTCELLGKMVDLSVVGERLRKGIQNECELNHLEMVEFFKKCLNSQQGVWRFCNMNSDEQYDFTIDDVQFLSTHIRSGNPIDQFTEQDIKQIICPLDMNFQKTITEMGAFYQSVKQKKQATVDGFYAHNQPQRRAAKTASTNFLGLTYHRTVGASGPGGENNVNAINVEQRPVTRHPEARQHLYLNVDPNESATIGGQGNMYLDNFIKQQTYSSSREMELDKFLSSRNGQKRFEKFEDNLPGNCSSSSIDQSGSAFIEY